MNQVVSLGHQVYKNLSPTDLTVLAGLAATALQYLVNQYKDFAKIVNFALSLVFPFLTTILVALTASGAPLTKYPTAFVVAQVVYQLVEWIKRNAVKQTAQF